MSVQPINNISFGQKYLNKQTYNQLTDILTKMNKQAVYVANDTNYKSSFLSEVFYNDFYIIDGRGFKKKVPSKDQLQKNTIIDTCFTQVVIDNKTGEIVNSHKPFIIPWDKLMKNIAKNIEFISKNFENTNLVKRVRRQATGLTQKGVLQQKKLNDDFKKLESEVNKSDIPMY